MHVSIGTTRVAAALRAAIPGVLVATLLSGCIMLPPLPFASQQEMPALSAYIPADVMSGAAELLVLAHRKTENRANLFSRRFEHTSAIDGHLVKGDQFAAFAGGLKMSRERGIHLIGVAGCMQLGAPCRGFAERQVNVRESLEKLCVVAADGREITLRTVARGATRCSRPCLENCMRRGATRLRRRCAHRENNHSPAPTRLAASTTRPTGRLAFARW